MTDLCLVSANFGGIDSLKELPSSNWIDSYYYTDVMLDDESLDSNFRGWTKIIKPNYPRYDFTPRLRAKYFKCQCNRLDESGPYRWIAWCDSSFKVKDSGPIVYWANQLRARSPRDRIAFVPHPDRTTVEQEFRFVRDLLAADNEYMAARYRDEKVQEQVDYYISRRWDLNVSLYNGGFFIAEQNEFTSKFFDDWWDQNIRYGVMDQISLSMMLSKNRMKPLEIQIDINDNICFTCERHEKNM